MPCDVHDIHALSRPEKPAWRQCPLCNAEIKKVSPLTGNEDQQYWNWVHEIKPPLPSGFKKRLIAVDALLKRDANERAAKINTQKKNGNKHGKQGDSEQAVPGGLLRGWGPNSATGIDDSAADSTASGQAGDMGDGPVVVKPTRQRGCCAIC